MAITRTHWECYLKLNTENLELLSPLAILPLLVPGHLDGFELALVGLQRIADKPRQFRDPFVQVCETHGQRIDVGMRVGQADGNVVEAVPIESLRHVSDSFSAPASEGGRYKTT